MVPTQENPRIESPERQVLPGKGTRPLSIPSGDIPQSDYFMLPWANEGTRRVHLKVWGISVRVEPVEPQLPSPERPSTGPGPTGKAWLSHII
jgi:hypothetical protein